MCKTARIAVLAAVIVGSAVVSVAHVLHQRHSRAELERRRASVQSVNTDEYRTLRRLALLKKRRQAERAKILREEMKNRRMPEPRKPDAPN